MSIFLIFIGLTIIFISSNLFFFNRIPLALMLGLILLGFFPFVLSWGIPFISDRVFFMSSIINDFLWISLFSIVLFWGFLFLMIIAFVFTIEQGKNSWSSFLGFLGR